MASLHTTKQPSTDWKRFRPLVDAALKEYSTFSLDCPASLQDALTYCLLPPGKRLRTTLTILAAEACGGSTAATMPAACAVEMIHAYSLVHDDLPAMDDDDLRRGQPTCHKAYGEANAILVGDALQSLAFETLCKLQPIEVAGRCCAALAVAAGPTALVGGQVADLAAENKNSISLQELQAIHRRKTGALITVSLQLGGMVAEATPHQLAALTTFGDHLGLAFQITYDLLDVKGDEATMGKRVGKDAIIGKATFPTLLGVAASTTKAEELIQQACESLRTFGPAAEALRSLAQFVLLRNN